jgi:endonuclease YncB( thermonuclease family)
MAWASSACAQVVGDGGMLTVGGSTYRLWGLVVPSETTACAGDWRAGAIASRDLGSLVAGKLVDCEYRGKDQDGTTLAVCRADGRDIGADMVKAGLAWSHTLQTHEYVLEEGMAMARLKGVHAHACRLPPQLINRPPVTPR